ncbi:MAG TPA: hypothetical protein VLF68_00525 [Candidatus Saccharimonadales bacterium]|nr:hypothetical protein [Candidatus Saccharimonadales bacterium]
MPKNSHYQHLAEKWLSRHGELEKNLWSKHGDTLHWLQQNSAHTLIGAVGGLLLLTTGFLAQGAAHKVQAQEMVIKPLDTSAKLLIQLHEKLPDQVRPLTADEEKEIGKVLSDTYNMKVSAELQGIRLNRSYGLIGAEQHLYRYPGDTLDQHFDTAEDANLYASSGVAPGLGAWGYFAPSRAQFGKKDEMREKYYIAVQTFLAPGFNEHVGQYGLFFKYRKMLVVNPENGKAIVADIADAGPSEFTGKHLGGSPEVMHYLERQDGAARGPVLYFFIDDPHDTIPLGPVENI